MNPKRQAFIDTAKSLGMTSPINRADVQTILDAGDGAFGWPSWITADKARRLDRGVFDVPELDGGSAPAPAEVASTPAPAPASAPAPAKTVSPVATCDYSMMGSLVPSRLSTYVPWGHFKDVESIIRSGSFYPTFITGLSGNGKTEMVTQVCAKAKRELFRVNITIETDEDDLLGGFRLIDGETVWQDGPAVVAMKRGGVLLLDEVDLGSNKLMCLQPILEGKGVFLKKINEWVKPAAGFTVFATANTKGKGDMDGRFLLVQWSEIIRKTYYEGGVDEIITTRRLNNIAQAFAIFGDRMKSIEMSIARFDDDTKESFLSLYTKIDADAVTDTVSDTGDNSCPF